jgi:drug/metabolite transporter (DMT)-like permease
MNAERGVSRCKASIIPHHQSFGSPLNFRQYLVIFSMMVFGASGDALLARGMKQSSAIDIHHILHVFAVLPNPYILLGIASLLLFMWSYMTALSFADLSYVMPATAMSYVLMTLLSVLWLHERVGARRWSGVLFIVIGVGLVAGEPWRTGEAPVAVAGTDEASERG